MSDPVQCRLISSNKLFPYLGWIGSALPHISMDSIKSPKFRSTRDTSNNLWLSTSFWNVIARANVSSVCFLCCVNRYMVPISTHRTTSSKDVLKWSRAFCRKRREMSAAEHQSIISKCFKTSRMQSSFKSEKTVLLVLVDAGDGSILSDSPMLNEVFTNQWKKHSFGKKWVIFGCGKHWTAIQKKKMSRTNLWQLTYWIFNFFFLLLTIRFLWQLANNKQRKQNGHRIVK